MTAIFKQLITQGESAIAMWGPGIAAIITTAFVMKQPFKNLRLNTLGAKHFYLWVMASANRITVIG